MKLPLASPLAACLAVVFCFCLTVADITAAPALLNGSFEDPALTGTNFASGSGAGWTATAGAYVITNSFGFGVSPYGNQWEELANDTDSQAVSGFAPGTSYVLSLAASDISGFTGDQLTLLVSGAAAATQTFVLPTWSDGQNPGALQFATYALTFTPTTTGPVTVTLGVGNNGGGAIDNVQLAMPEPSSWALCAFGGLGLLGWPRCRRQFN